MDDDDPGAGYALFGDKGELATSPHGDLRAYTFAGRTLHLHQSAPATPTPLNTLHPYAQPRATGSSSSSRRHPGRPGPRGWDGPPRSRG